MCVYVYVCIDCIAFDFIVLDCSSVHYSKQQKLDFKKEKNLSLNFLAYPKMLYSIEVCNIRTSSNKIRITNLTLIKKCFIL